jgi:electron transport complex protein RnfC
MHLTPLYMHMFSDKGDWAQCEKYRMMDCMECGSCAYVCPDHRPLVQNIRRAKAELRKQLAKDKK